MRFDCVLCSVFSMMLLKCVSVLFVVVLVLCMCVCWLLMGND